MNRINCVVKNYSWGKKGSNSEVARLFAAGHEHSIDPTKPYSELWMGTHPDGPSKLQNSTVYLSEFIAKTTCLESVNKEMHLSFIMKIMSINHSLSLQLHPTKEQAEFLHNKDPKNYPDCNHKPELAYALTKFELLCGFRPAAEILQNIHAFSELRALMGEAETAEFENVVANSEEDSAAIKEEALKRCFTNLLYSQIKTPFLVEEMLKSFYSKIEKGIRGALLEDTISVIFSLLNNFPGDVGGFSPLFLNHIILQPGECCFYGAGELHAYLSGECVECVGCSNNTIRAALTPKFIDREAVIQIAKFQMTNPTCYLVPPKTLEMFPHVREFAPNCKDFVLHEIQLLKLGDSNSQNLSTSLPPLQCASIMIIVEGNGEYDTSAAAEKTSIKRGDIFYIAPGQNVQIESHSDRFVAFRTFSFEKGPKNSARQLG